MRRQEWPATIERIAAIRFECIGEVIKRYVECNSQEHVGESVQHQFVEWVIDNTAAPNESRAENGVPAGIQQMPISNDVPAIVRLIRHHDNHRIAAHVIKTMRDR